MTLVTGSSVVWCWRKVMCRRNAVWANIGAWVPSNVFAWMMQDKRVRHSGADLGG